MATTKPDPTIQDIRKEAGELTARLAGMLLGSYDKETPPEFYQKAARLMKDLALVSQVNPQLRANCAVALLECHHQAQELRDLFKGANTGAADPEATSTDVCACERGECTHPRRRHTMVVTAEACTELWAAHGKFYEGFRMPEDLPAELRAIQDETSCVGNPAIAVVSPWIMFGDAPPVKPEYRREGGA